jgi:hypothetical protein
MPKIEVEIGGDVSELEAKILKAKELLKELQTKLKEERLLKVDTSETLAAIKIAKSEIVSLQSVSSKNIAIKIAVDAVIPADVVAKVEDIADKVEKTSKKVKNVIIKPIIEVDTKPLVEADKAVVNLKEKVAKPIPSLKIDLGDKIVNETEKAGKGLNKLGQQAEKTAISTNKLTRATGNGSNTLMQFSRIAQDAPFGIMGIGNNITATAESFSYLSKSSGGAGAALKSVASSMMGVGGILLAVSLVTSALTYMSQNGITVGDIFDKLSGNFDAVGNSMKKAFDEGAKSALEERGNLLGLISVAQSEVVSREARLQAVNDLQSKYPAYFGNLSKEHIMYGDLTTAVNEITKALISKAVAEKLAKDAVQPTIDLFKANAALVAQKKEQIRMEQELAAENKKNIDAGYGGASRASVNLKNAIANNGLAIKETRSNIGDLTKVVDSYEKNISKVSQAAAQLSVKPIEIELEEPTPDLEEVITKGKALDIEVKPFVKPESFVSFNESFTKGNQSSAFDSGISFVPKTSGIVIPDLGVDAAAIEANMKLQEGLAMQQETLKKFNEGAASIISGNISDTFANLGSVIGGAIANGGNVLEAAGSALLAGLGSVMVELGKMAIATGVGILGVKLALKTLNPAVAIAGGVALVALGSVFSSKAGGLGNSMGGGGSSSGNGTSTNSGGNSYQGASGGGGGGFSSGGGYGSVVFEISGNSLIGVLGNALDKNKRLGGNLRVG